MLALTPDDLLPLDEYAARRADHLADHLRYLDRYRRVRVGPSVTLVFENRQTVWFKAQELLRVARLTDPARVREELAWYNTLLPARNRLQAAFVIALPDGPGLTDALKAWRGLTGDCVRLHIDDEVIAARLVTDREADLSSGTAHWLEFDLDRPARLALRDSRRVAVVEVQTPNYDHVSAPLGEDVRHSLYDDLDLSDRDAA